MSVVKTVADTYQPLFDLMSEEHGLVLTVSQMSDLIEASDKVHRKSQISRGTQGEHRLELKFVDSRVFLNYWDWAHGNDVCVQVKSNQLLQFVHSANEIEADDFDGDALVQKEITIADFVEMVKASIEQISV